MIWAWRDPEDSLFVYFSSPARLREFVSKVNALLSIGPSRSVPAIVEKSKPAVHRTKDDHLDLIFIGFEIKGRLMNSANEDLFSKAQKRLDEVFDDIFSVHFVTKGFGYVCCGSRTPELRGFTSGRNLFPIYETSWLDRHDYKLC